MPRTPPKNGKPAARKARGGNVRDSRIEALKLAADISRGTGRSLQDVVRDAESLMRWGDTGSLEEAAST